MVTIDFNIDLMEGVDFIDHAKHAVFLLGSSLSNLSLPHTGEGGLNKQIFTPSDISM